MKHTFFHGLLVLAAALLPFSCKTEEPVNPAPDNSWADVLIESAHMAHDNNRIIALADSLESVGAFSRIKADYWRGYGYYSQWNNHLCQQYWYEAVTLDIKDREDLIYYGRSANRLSDVLLSRGDYEAALRVALPAIDKLREEDLAEFRDFGYLLVVVGCCELNNRNKALADTYFDDSYKLFTRLISDSAEAGGAPHLDNIKTAVAALTTISRHYLDKNYYADVLVWLDRLQKVLDEYRVQPETVPDSYDRRQTLALIFKATALEGLGSHEAAAAAYEEALRHDFCSSPLGKVESARYLMLARRWTEAADNYQPLDDVASITGAGLTLNNIQLYVIPKYRANFNARRNDDALATGIQLCDALDSAIVWNRKDKAAELSAAYHTQEIQEEIIEQRTHLERLRLMSSIAVVVLILACFIIFVLLRYRSSLRLEEAYMELESANAQAEEASQVKTAFLQQISHEVGTPLHLICGFAQLLTTPGLELDEASKEEINKGIVTNTGRITSLVNKMLELSNLMSMTQLERADRVSPRQIADEAAITSGITTTPEIDFEVRGSGEMDFTDLTTNKRAASHVLALLLENAVKFTEKGSICLRVVLKQKFIYFFVEDTGIGIPSSEAEHIFEQFVQLDEFREGTGIGLTVARSIARRLGGDVILDTSYNFGARFVFSLPRDNAQ